MIAHRCTVALCDCCGFTMVSAVVVNGVERAPQDGDASICGGCGMLYVLDGGAWRGARIVDLVALPQAALDAVLGRVEAASASRRLPPRKATLH